MDEKKRKVEPLGQTYRLLNTGCVLVVSVGDGERDNLFSVTWNMPVRKDPPMVAIQTGKRHYSYQFIEKTGEFGLNVLTAEWVDAVYGCGSTTGHKVQDKFSLFSLNRESAEAVQSPLIAEAIANLECRVAQVHDMGASALVVANIVGARAHLDHFAGGNWVFDNGLKLIHHMGSSRFCVSDREIRAKPPSQ